MKKLLSIITVISLLSFPLVSQAGPTNWGRMITSNAVGLAKSGGVTGVALNSAFMRGASGSAVGVLFSSPVSQTNGNLTFYAYCTAVTGSPTNSVAIIYNVAYNGTSPDKPNVEAALATSTNTDASGCGTAKWLTYSFSGGVSLQPGSTYWLLIINTTATPASNNFTITKRGPIDYYHTAVYGSIGYNEVETTDGFSTAYNGGVYMFPSVIKFNDGTTMGFPFPANRAAHSSDTNWRGFRIQFTNNIKSSCAFFSDISSGGVSGFAIYQGSTAVFSTTTTNTFYQTRQNVVCYPQITLSAGLNYDYVVQFNLPSSVTSSTGDMGNSPPADVTGINSQLTVVDGATPGSFTQTTTESQVGIVYIDDNPLTSSGGTGNGTAGIIINGRVQIQ